MKVLSRIGFVCLLLLQPIFAESIQVKPDDVLAVCRSRSLYQLAPVVKRGTAAIFDTKMAQETIWPMVDLVCRRSNGVDDEANVALYFLKVRSDKPVATFDDVAILGIARVVPHSVAEVLLSRFHTKRFGEWLVCALDDKIINDLESIDWLIKDVSKPIVEADVVANVTRDCLDIVLNAMDEENNRPEWQDDNTDTRRQMYAAMREFCKPIEAIDISWQWTDDEMLCCYAVTMTPETGLDAMSKDLTKDKSCWYNVDYGDDVLWKIRYNLNTDGVARVLDKQTGLGQSREIWLGAVLNILYENIAEMLPCFTGDVVVTVSPRVIVADCGVIADKTVNGKTLAEWLVHMPTNNNKQKIVRYNGYTIVTGVDRKRLSNYTPVGINDSEIMWPDALQKFLMTEASISVAAKDDVFLMIWDLADDNEHGDNLVRIQEVIDQHIASGEVHCTNLGIGMLGEAEMDLAQMLALFGVNELKNAHVQSYSTVAIDGRAMSVKYRIPNTGLKKLIDALQAAESTDISAEKTQSNKSSH